MISLLLSYLVILITSTKTFSFQRNLLEQKHSRWISHERHLLSFPVKQSCAMQTKYLLSSSTRIRSTSELQPHSNVDKNEGDMFGDVEDEVLLEKYRRQRILDNDRWQASILEDVHCGSWIGIYDIFRPQLSPAGVSMSLAKIASGTVFTEQTRSKVDDRFRVKENYQLSYEDKALVPIEGYDYLTSATLSVFAPEKLRVSEGNQCVGSGFTLASLHRPSDSRLFYVAEEGIRLANLRTRVRYLYKKEAGAEIARLAGLCLIREISSNGAEMQSSKSIQELFEFDKEGLGIFDPQVQNNHYHEMKLPGKVTLLFPTEISAFSEKTCLTMEWIDSTTRYQIDRIFSSFNTPAIKTLELTEVKIEDAEKYSALHPERPPFLL